MNSAIPALAATLFLVPSPPATPSQQPTRALVRVRVRDDVIRDSLVIVPPAQEAATHESSIRPHRQGHVQVGSAAFSAPAWHGQAVPGGGTLDPIAFANPTTTGSVGRIAFFSNVSGAARNQGIFTTGAQGLVPVVLGCGGGGGSGNPGNGCGDPSPIGGTFSGFFGGTVFAPASNPGGDLLFVAEVDGGSSPRGLFLYRAATQTILKVAAVGDPSPAGGTFGAIGPGSLNVQGDVAFIATGASPNDHQILLWQQGVTTLVARDGNPAPGGGVYQYVHSESFGFADGTSIPIGPLPDLNNAGQIAFRGIATGGNVSRGIVVWQGGSSQWYVAAGDPTPSGGTFFDMQGASINDAGEVAFFADFRPTPTTFNSGWFVGSPGSWRTGLAFFDPVGGGQCFGLAFSRPPMEFLSNNGDLVLWTDVQMPGGAMVEHIVVRHANGQLEIAARQGDPGPRGGTIGTMDAWPALNQAGSATVNAATPGASGGSLSAHMLHL